MMVVIFLCGENKRDNLFIDAVQQRLLNYLFVLHLVWCQVRHVSCVPIKNGLPNKSG